MAHESSRPSTEEPRHKAAAAPARLDARSHLAAIVESSDDPIISKDLNGIIISWNQAATRVFGYEPEEIVGESILRLIPPELQHEEATILNKIKNGERIDHFETVRLRKNGERFPISVTISPVRDETGQVIGASKIARDVSDRKRMERLLIQSEKLAATGRMAAAIAHEINNPLESLMNLIFLARRNSLPDGKAYCYLQTAEEELIRVSHIARQTLGYYRNTASPAEVYLRDLIQNVLTVYKARLLDSSIRVDAQFHDLQKILVNQGELVQVFSNVMANAIDAMRLGGVLAISLRNFLGAEGDGIQIVFRDNGVGIRPEHLERIFEPFFTTKGDLGTGIGLWVAKQLIEKRGGRIAVASSTVAGSSGTTITIFLPFLPPALQGEGQTEAAPALSLSKSA